MKKNGKEINPRGVRVEFGSYHHGNQIDSVLKEMIREECGGDAVTSMKVVRYSIGRYVFVEFENAADAGAFLRESMESKRFKVKHAFKQTASKKKTEVSAPPSPSSTSWADLDDSGPRSPREGEVLSSEEALAAEIAEHCRIPQSATTVTASFLVQTHLVYSWNALLDVEEVGLTSRLNLPVGIAAVVKREQERRKRKKN